MYRFLCLLFMPLLAFSQNPTLVVSQPIKSGILNQNHTYVGSLYFSERASLASEVSGVIDEIYVYRARYEINKKNITDFYDLDYVCWVLPQISVFLY